MGFVVIQFVSFLTIFFVGSSWKRLVVCTPSVSTFWIAVGVL